MSYLEQGDIIEIDFNPTVGHEPAKLRPAVVITDYAFNSRSSMTGVVPIQWKDNGYPLHVPLEADGIKGFACVEMARNVDVDYRGYRVVGVVPAQTMERILSIVKGMYGFH